MSVASSSDESDLHNYRQIDSWGSLLKNINLFSRLQAYYRENFAGKNDKFEEYIEDMRIMIFDENKDVYADGWDDYIDTIAHGQVIDNQPWGKGGGKHTQIKSKSTQVKHKRKRLTKKHRYSRSVRQNILPS